MYENTDLNINLNLIYTGNLPYKTHSKYAMVRHKSHSTLCLASLALPLPLPLPVPILILIKIIKLDDNNHILSYCDVLKHKGGIYCFVITINNKQYVGSAKDLYARLI